MKMAHFFEDTSKTYLLGRLSILSVLCEVKLSISSAAQSCPTLCDPVDGSTTGLPVHHQLPEFTQTHVH